MAWSAKFMVGIMCKPAMSRFFAVRLGQTAAPRVVGMKAGGAPHGRGDAVNLHAVASCVMSGARKGLEPRPASINNAAIRMTSMSGNSKRASPPVEHASDCAAHNAPAYPAGPCDCGAAKK